MKLQRLIEFTRKGEGVMISYDELLRKFKIHPCSTECVDGVGMTDISDVETWHHPECINHPYHKKEKELIK